MMAPSTTPTMNFGSGSLPRHVAGLLDPSAWPFTDLTPTLVQTHISWIVLAGAYVYKLKKPVSLGFLDYSTLENRRVMCEREVALNRRLCPGVYLGVVPVIDQDGHIRVDQIGSTAVGDRRIVDYAVWMRRLPHTRMLDVLLRGAQAGHEMVETVADQLIPFHASAATGLGVDEYGTPEAVLANVRENFAQARPFVGHTLRAETWAMINCSTMLFLERHRALFEHRVAEGRIGDGHGDLHAASICMLEPVVIFDCIEFNDRFRCGDVAGEVAFLAMDLEFYGREDLADVFVDRYVAHSGDQQIRELLDFYICYRAFVRGKVESFKLEEPEFTDQERAIATGRADRYFRLAEKYAARMLQHLHTVGCEYCADVEPHFRHGMRRGNP
jgi:aminoglycoside phosphotransferase family enzyme